MPRSLKSAAFTLSTLALLSVTACAPREAAPGSASKAAAPTSPYSGARGAEAPSAELSRGAARPSGAPRAAATEGAYDDAPRAEERPGLGTEWGETRESRVSSAPFVRRDFDTPLSATRFFYNDEAGVRAALGSGYWDRRTDGVNAARGAITIRVVDERGAALPTFSSGGRSYVLGDDGARYSIRIDNSTSERFEAVATVDGLDVIDGQPGSFTKRGYLVGPWSSVEIDGFRRSEEEVAAFRFGRVRDAYATRRGDDRNVGVIGVAVFSERGASYPWTRRELERRDSADAFPGRFAPAP